MSREEHAAAPFQIQQDIWQSTTALGITAYPCPLTTIVFVLSSVFWLPIEISGADFYLMFKWQGRPDTSNPFVNQKNDFAIISIPACRLSGSQDDACKFGDVLNVHCRTPEAEWACSDCTASSYDTEIPVGSGDIGSERQPVTKSRGGSL
ncbi:hypothetical protein BDW59DRAFT_166161 [Aspergillus cavernicola]|uniref:Uncharacterized protein n=1 Tax=Aspergillus cavernicola TaxID=176166 RepID=A0ABR4HNH8_9EURO